MVDKTVTKIIYTGDNKTKVFPFPFDFAAPEDVKVAVYDEKTDEEQTLTRDFFLDEKARTITYPGYTPGSEPLEKEQPPVLSNSQKIVIYRETPIVQLTDLGNKYPLPTIEAMPDKLTFICQELRETLDRCVKTQINGSETPEEFAERLLSTAKEAIAATEAAQKYKEQAEKILAEIQNGAATAEDLRDNVNNMRTQIAELQALCNELAGYTETVPLKPIVSVPQPDSVRYRFWIQPQNSEEFIEEADVRAIDENNNVSDNPLMRLITEDGEIIPLTRQIRRFADDDVFTNADVAYVMSD